MSTNKLKAKNKKATFFANEIVRKLNRIGSGPNADELLHAVSCNINDTIRYYTHMLAVHKKEEDSVTSVFKVDVKE